MGQQRPCSVAPFEPLLRLFVARIFLAGLPAGSVIDAGAHKGGESCFFSDLARERTVHAVEPLIENIDYIRNHYADRPNIRPQLGGLGNSSGWLAVTADSGGMASGLGGGRRLERRASAGGRRSVPVSTIDSLFAADGPWANETLAFGHFDVEGSELALLSGGSQTIQRDQPVFTVEVHVHKDHAYTRALFEYIDALGYDAFIIDEGCGSRNDCRNAICVPRCGSKCDQRTLPASRDAAAGLSDALRETLLRDAARVVNVSTEDLLSAPPVAGCHLAHYRTSCALLGSPLLQPKLYRVRVDDMPGTLEGCCSRPIRKRPIRPRVTPVAAATAAVAATLTSTGSLLSKAFSKLDVRRASSAMHGHHSHHTPVTRPMPPSDRPSTGSLPGGRLGGHRKPSAAGRKIAPPPAARVQHARTGDSETRGEEG